MSYQIPVYPINDYIIHKDAIKVLLQWISDFEEGKEVPPCAVIYGTPGSGKTTLIYSIFKVVEILNTTRPSTLLGSTVYFST